MRTAIAFAAGVLFAVGLGVSQMTNPNKVVGFLDLFGDWDPSLAFVMVGAMGVFWLPSLLTLRRGRPVFDSRLHLAEFTAIDGRLLGGSALFGIGWGALGYCPGPALVATGAGSAQALLFTVAMLAGMAAFQLVPVPGPTPERKSA